MAKMSFSGCLILFVALCLVLLHSGCESFAIKPQMMSAMKRGLDEANKPHSRQKRFSEYQETASAFCTGLCMYEERRAYSDCFDQCNYYW